ncbi:MAG: hypothetical protein ABMB14_29170 [Myxococcota bacterium]
MDGAVCCPGCGAAHAPGSRFCAGCGAVRPVELGCAACGRVDRLPAQVLREGWRGGPLHCAGCGAPLSLAA